MRSILSTSMCALACIFAITVTSRISLSAGPPDMAATFSVDMPQTWDDGAGIRRPRGRYVFTLEDWEQCRIGVYTEEQARGAVLRTGKAPSSLNGLCTTMPIGSKEFKFSDGDGRRTMIFTHPHLSALMVTTLEYAGRRQYVFVPFELKGHTD